MKRILGAAFASCLLIAGIGCETGGVRRDSGWRHHELEGFPQPNHFEFKDGYLFSPQKLAGEFRPTWIGRYSGPGKPENHVPFYIREMQKRGWRLSELVSEESTGNKTLEFIKGDEGTTIELSRSSERTRYGSFNCKVRAEVRTLGLESFSIEENLSLVGKKASGETATGTGSGEAIDSHGENRTNDDGEESPEGVPSVSPGRIPPAAGDDPSGLSSDVLPTSGSPSGGSPVRASGSGSFEDSIRTE